MAKQPVKIRRANARFIERQQRIAARIEFWRKFHEPRQRREMLQRLADALAAYYREAECG